MSDKYIHIPKWFFLKNVNINLEQYIKSHKDGDIKCFFRKIEEKIFIIERIYKRVGYIYCRDLETMLFQMLKYYFVADMIKYYEMPIEERISEYGGIVPAKISNHFREYFNESSEEFKRWIDAIYDNKDFKLKNNARAKEKRYKYMDFCNLLIGIPWYFDYLCIIFRTLLNDVAWNLEDRSIYRKLVLLDDLNEFKSISKYVISQEHDNLYIKYSNFNFAFNKLKNKLTFDQVCNIFRKLFSEFFKYVLPEINNANDNQIIFKFNVKHELKAKELKTLFFRATQIRNFSCHLGGLDNQQSGNNFLKNLFEVYKIFSYNESNVYKNAIKELKHYLEYCKKLYDEIADDINKDKNIDNKIIDEISNYINVKELQLLIEFLSNQIDCK